MTNNIIVHLKTDRNLDPGALAQGQMFKYEGVDNTVWYLRTKDGIVSLTSGNVYKDGQWSRADIKVLHPGETITIQQG